MYDGRQLDFFPSEVARIPWGGRDVRELTRGHLLLYSRREPGAMRSPPDPAQCEMFLRNQARRYAGALLLLRR